MQTMTNLFDRSTPGQENGRSIPTGPYGDSLEHLWDELHRLDVLIRAQTVRWRHLIGATKPSQEWGMINVSEEEVNAYLHSPFYALAQISPTLEKALHPYWEEAKTWAGAIAARLESTPAQIDLRVQRLKTLFGLSDLERDIVLISLLPELDDRYRRLFGYLQDDASQTRPSAELVLQTLCWDDRAAGRAAFDPAASLLRCHLITLSPAPESAPLAVRRIQIDARAAGFLLGSDQVDGRLVDLVSVPGVPVLLTDLICTEEERNSLRQLAAWWVSPGDDRTGAVLFLHGLYGSGRQRAAQALCTEIDMPLLIVNTPRALALNDGWQTLVELAYREARLQGAALYWANCDVLLDPLSTSQWQVMLAAVESWPGLTFFASEQGWEPAGYFRARLFVRLEFPVPGYPLRCQMWAAHLPEQAEFAVSALTNAEVARDVVIELLANIFQFTEGQITDAVQTAQGQAVQHADVQPGLTLDDLYNGCRRQAGRNLISFTRLIDAHTELTFDDLILPAASLKQIRELRGRLRDRHQVYNELGFGRRMNLGKGLIVLFTGTSGTGKTMAAELIAQDLRVNLYKVDLSAVVSKYVGETEKNLSRVFAEAEAANAILFFDEADALFSKRGEVKEARDRWANIETNYLLQRIEEYGGVVILATNFRQNIDEAFLRRIHAVVEFPFPNAEARYRILCGLFPPEVDCPPEEELRALAEQFRLTGGSLKNVVIDAAFRAVAEAGEGDDAAPVPGGPQKVRITQAHLVLAIAREYQKLGKPLTKGEFGKDFYQAVVDGLELVEKGKPRGEDESAD